MTAPNTLPDAGNPPTPPDSTVRVILSRIPFSLAYLDTVSGIPTPMLTISSGFNSRAALLPMISALVLTAFFVLVRPESISAQSCHCEYGISKLPVRDSYDACLGSGGISTIASTRHPGMMVL
ncbi:unknown [Coprococcus eutactus CAG:665]|nr:unknown [Coprococcus eutactus CAG:665]